MLVGYAHRGSRSGECWAGVVVGLRTKTMPAEANPGRLGSALRLGAWLGLACRHRFRDRGVGCQNSRIGIALSAVSFMLCK